MRLLVTGGCGFIGSNFIRYWLNNHNDYIVNYDLLTYAGRPNTMEMIKTACAYRDRYRFLAGDVCDQKRLEYGIEKWEIDTIVHFAAETHNSRAILDPTVFVRTNVLGTQTVLEVARKYALRLHHVSTCEVYGDQELEYFGAGFRETDGLFANTPYSASKAAADQLVMAYVKTFDTRATISRCCNNMGSHQMLEKVIPKFITSAMRDEPLTMYESSENKREWIHVYDHIRAIECILLRAMTGAIYNVGTGGELSVLQVAQAILCQLDKPYSLIKRVPDRPQHDRRYLLNSDKLKADLGWAPIYIFGDALKLTIEFYRENEDWWEPLLLLSRMDDLQEDQWDNGTKKQRLANLMHW